LNLEFQFGVARNKKNVLGNSDSYSLSSNSTLGIYYTSKYFEGGFFREENYLFRQNIEVHELDLYGAHLGFNFTPKAEYDIILSFIIGETTGIERARLYEYEKIFFIQYMGVGIKYKNQFGKIGVLAQVRYIQFDELIINRYNEFDFHNQNWNFSVGAFVNLNTFKKEPSIQWKNQFGHI